MGSNIDQNLTRTARLAKRIANSSWKQQWSSTMSKIYGSRTEVFNPDLGINLETGLRFSGLSANAPKGCAIFTGLLGLLLTVNPTRFSEY
jgi:hypothetical protein